MLTPRQIEVLRLATMTNRQIGARLWISHHTVKRHFTAIYERLGIADGAQRTRALIMAIKMGLIELDEVGGGGVA